MRGTHLNCDVLCERVGPTYLTDELADIDKLVYGIAAA
jgi:hypothetical protein